MKEKKIAKANGLGEFYFGLVCGKEYVLERTNNGTWSVYDTDGSYVKECRTDCFDDYRDYENLTT